MLLVWPRPWADKAKGPAGTPNTTLLLKEHCNKMTPNDILLHCRSVPYSAITGDASSWANENKYREPSLQPLISVFNTRKKILQKCDSYSCLPSEIHLEWTKPRKCVCVCGGGRGNTCERFFWLGLKWVDSLLVWTFEVRKTHMYLGSRSWGQEDTHPLV